MYISSNKLMMSQSTHVWVLGVGIGIMLMIMVGGYTRLTHAGLSLVDWKPVVGVVPPLTADDWQAEWARYRQFPEFQKGVVTDFVLFQKLFWIEYAHRLLGRLVGLWLVVGFLIGLASRRWPSWLSRRAFLWCLGIGFQGWMGWYMVKSGLVKDPQVSPCRLTAHLWVALILLTSVAGTYVSLVCREKKMISQPWYVYLAQIMAGITLTFGGLVAGHKAGLVYNTFPLMEGHIMPSEVWFYRPVWVNVWGNPIGVQFLHRCFALVTLALITFVFWKMRTRQTAVWCAFVYTQVGLGIATLLTQVHCHTALMHQMFGVLLWLWGWVMVSKESCDH